MLKEIEESLEEITPAALEVAKQNLLNYSRQSDEAFLIRAEINKILDNY